MSNIEVEGDVVETGMELGRFEQVDIKKVWSHEALNFTPWLVRNIDLLEEHLPFKFDRGSVSSEERTGRRPSALKLDILAQSENDDSVIIENQFGESNHDHLGKILTYATAFEAKVAIWIAEDFRTEHINAVAWLNNSTSLNVYMFKIEVLKIGSSLPAPLLTLVVGPSESDGEVYASKQEKSKRVQAKEAFYDELLEHARTQTELHSGESRIVKVNKGGLYLIYAVQKTTTTVSVWIDRGDGSYEWNDAVFDQLSVNKEIIEETFGEPLSWTKEPLGRNVRGLLSSGGWADKKRWPEIIEATVAKMIKLEKAVSPYLQEAVDAADAAVAAIDSDESDQ